MDYFENAGNKIGKIVNVAFTILLVVCGLAALAVIIAAITTVRDGFGAALLVLIIGLLGVGIILGLGYLAFVQTAAFAELVRNSGLILDAVKKEKVPEAKPIVRREEQPKPQTAQEPAGTRKSVTCPKCGKSQFDGRSTCFSCGAPLK